MNNSLKRNSNEPIQVIGKVTNILAIGILAIFGMWMAGNFWKLVQGSHEQQDLVFQSEDQESRLEAFERASNKIAEPIAKFRERIVNEKNLSGIQDKLIKLAKQSGCNLKRSTPKGHYSRPLSEKGLDEDSADLLHIAVDEVEFMLHQEVLLVSVEGVLENLLKFMKALDQQNWLCSMNETSIQRRIDDDAHLSLEIEISFYDVVPNANAIDLRSI